MNCSKKKLIRKIHKFIIKAITVANGFSLLFWMCAIDSIISWQPYVIMMSNVAWLFLVLYANGWIVDTEPYYERMERYEEM